MAVTKKTTKKKPLTLGQRFQLDKQTRSKFEDKAIITLNKLGIDYEYEPKDKKLNYIIPATHHKYLPDIVIKDHFFELKGYIQTIAERQKYVHIKNQHPNIKLIMVFQNPNLPINKGSKTTYKKWFEDNGIMSITFDEFNTILTHYKEYGEFKISS